MVGGAEDPLEDLAEFPKVGKVEVDDGDFVFKFRRQLEATARGDQRVPGALGEAKEILQPADEHRVVLIEVHLQVAQHDDVALAFLAEEGFNVHEGFQRIRARGGASGLEIHEAVGGRPRVEVALEFGTGGGQFGLSACFFRGDEDESGVAGTEVGGEHDGC